ncbi:LPS biosynthesis protein [Clostridia bacterium]|nr:LPS biosynthesis protein [Clostridia bacterium]
MSNREQEKEEILKRVEAYAKKYHQVNKPYQKGEKIPYAGRVYDQAEMVNLVDSALEFWLTEGDYTRKFEEKLKKYLAIDYCSLVNSGSSANLLAFMTLTSPLLKERQIKRGDEVITLAAGFPTTVAPILQYGAVPVFLDITIPEYSIDVSQLEQAFTERTKAVMVAHTLGNPFPLKEVKDFCKQHNLWLIEDNCDALGSRYQFDGEWKFTGTIGDIGTSSFYPAHHITTGEGGAVYTKDPLLNRIMRSFRDWGRACTCPSGVDNSCGHRFDGQYGELPKGYDHKYVYSHFGYNLKATDMQAAVGVAQLDKLSYFVQKRRENFAYLYDRLKDLEQFFYLPKALEESEPSWFGFLLTVKDEKKIERNLIVQHLEKKGIQTRMLFAGNLLAHPCFDSIRHQKGVYRLIGNLQNTDYVMRNTFWLGVYPGMQKEQLDYMVEQIHDYIKSDSQ